MISYVDSVKHAGKTMYKVRIKHEHQRFTLDFGGPRAECRWMAKMFNIALKLHDKKQRERAQ